MKTYQILIVDDEPDHLDTISEIIEGVDNGYEVLEAQSGPMAYEIARAEHPDLIITDWDMPEMSGIDLIRCLKQHEDTCDIPVIMCTGVMTTSEHLETVLIAGAVDYIRKPVDSIELTARINSMLTLADSLLQLKSAKEKAEVANQIKSTFLANMSHELRSPLTAILGFAQMLVRDCRFERDQRESLNIIIRSGEHLLSLLNQVLDISKIEAGRVTLNTKNFDLYRLLDEVEDMFILKATHKHLHLLFERDETVPQCIRTDEMKLRQILINLLNNAVKFTQEGGIVLRISDCGLGIANGENPKSEIRNLKFEISDTGPGIAPEEMDKLFEAFGQTESGRSTNEGTGLGLPISRKFAQLMGGDIRVKSEVGCGATFICDIQADIVSANEIEDVRFAYRRAIALEPGQRSADGSRYRLLVVDDKQDNRQLLITLLNPFGFELQEAEHGQEAIKIWKTWKPHLIWMDLRMPIMDGYEATRQIRTLNTGNTKELESNDFKSQVSSFQFQTKIIALTASGDEDERAIALSAGCDDFLHKPFKAEDIFDMLHTHLGVRFVYEEGQQSTIDNRQSTIEKVLTPEALAALPAQWLKTLKQGAHRADFLLLSSVIEQIREQDARLAGALAQLAENFEYDEILAFIQQIGKQTME